jgi:general secretion pathway protein G
MIRQDNQHRVIRRAAFTLMEVLVVVAIIVILASLGGFLLINQYNESKDEIVRARMKTIETAIDSYYINSKGYYPDNLGALLNTHLKSQKDLLDPWDQPFQYQIDNNVPTGYRLWTTNPRTGRVFTNLD